ncbi:MAG: hypothetical protein K0R77_919 [Chryseobacterium sp.]|jgi:hypothetical protein|nr:hypothetical protein [Chryseobacterium sp.]
MKKLKQLSRENLKLISGGWYDCSGPFPPAICKCKRGEQLCPNGTCIPINQFC